MDNKGKGVAYEEKRVTQSHLIHHGGGTAQPGPYAPWGAKAEDRRLSVMSVMTEITIDEDSDSSRVDTSDEGSDSEAGAPSESTGATSESNGTDGGRSPEPKRGYPAARTRSSSKQANPPEATGEYRLAWLWIEGWRERLRKSGDIVEKARWEWRVDDLVRRRPQNNIPVIVARVPGVSVLKGAEVRSGQSLGRKSVHWE
ncbi:hypothetical protein VTK73DRAFT_9878 [Phialemonium thermophilum]|uniref:Uncharacterized protein n=1 Tax=Phialemonium thermophilum TaxID=223376 RepID=A0ABR3VZW3_9PEZI